MVTYHSTESTSNKFWSFEKKGTDVLVKWGRVGQTGQEKIHEFGSSAAQQKFIDKKTREKLKKGYKLIDQKEKKKQERIASLLGTQYKINRMEFVDRKKDILNRLLNYDPRKFVYVEIINTWKKGEVHRLLLSKGETFEIFGVSEMDRKIGFDEIRPTRSQFTMGVREALKELYKRVASTIKKFAALGVRKLSLGDDPVDQDLDEPVFEDVYAELGEESAVNKQVVSKFAAMGARVLDL